MRQVILYPDQNGAWFVQCPSLPDCYSTGKTKEEAIQNIQDAIALWLESAKANGEPIPEERFEASVLVIEDTAEIAK